MKLLFFIAILFLSPNKILAQSLLDKQATFSGGDSAWKEYLIKNFRVDEVIKKIPSKKKAYSETALVRFIIKKDGTVSNIEVTNKVHEALKEEAIRLIKYSPNWIPGYIDNLPVNSYRTQPITIEINPE